MESQSIHGSLTINRLLLLVGMGVWVVFLAIARANYYTFFQVSGVLGSPVTLLTLFLWLAIVLTATGIMFSSADRGLPAYIAVLFVVFYFTPALLQENARVYDSFSHLGQTEAILETNHLSPGQISYHSWPGAFLWAAIFLRVLNLPDGIFLYFFPIFPLVGIAVGLYLIAKKLVDRNSKAMLFIVPTALVFLAENNSLQTHFSPQSLGFTMVIFFAYALLRYEFNRSSGGIYALLCLVLFVGLTITHLPSTLFALFALIIAASLGTGSRGWREVPSWTLAALSTATFVSWHLFQVYDFGGALLDLLASFLSILLIGGQAFSGIRLSTTADPFLSNLSILRHLFFFSLGAYGFFRALRHHDRIFPTILAYTVGAASFFMFSLAFIRGVLWERTILFGSFPLALSAGYVIGRNHTSMKKILLALCLTFLVLNSYTMYSLEAQNVVPTSEVSTAYFVVSKVASRSITTFTDAIVFFADPFYGLRSIQAVDPVDFKPSMFTHPPPGICQVIQSGQLQPLLGKSRYQNFTIQMEHGMNILYSTGFEMIYQGTRKCS